MTHIVQNDTLGFLPFDKIIAVISIGIVIYVNIKGTSETGKSGKYRHHISVGLILILIIAGLGAIFTFPNWQTNFSDFMPMGIGGIVCSPWDSHFIAFEGYEVMIQTGEEVKNPRRNIPRAIFLSLTAVVVLYCLVAFVSIGSIHPNGIPSWKYIGENGELGIMKAAELFLPYGAFIVLARRIDFDSRQH